MASRKARTLGLLLIWACASPASRGESISVEYARERIENDLYVIDARLTYDFSKTALDALQSGVPLIFEVEIAVAEVREYLWDQRVLYARQKYRLEYHSLSGQYVITELATRRRDNYTDLDSALAALGSIQGLPIGEVVRLENDEDPLMLQLRCRLDISELPPPLRPIAYISPQWRLSSSWYEWELHR